MTEREMFEKSFERPWNYFCLNNGAQWHIDNRLGILDWKGEGLTEADQLRFQNHYKKPEEPDAYCHTEPDGSCSSTDPRCMHQPKS